MFEAQGLLPEQAYLAWHRWPQPSDIVATQRWALARCSETSTQQVYSCISPDNIVVLVTSAMSSTCCQAEFNCRPSLDPHHSPTLPLNSTLTISSLFTWSTCGARALNSSPSAHCTV